MIPLNRLCLEITIEKSKNIILNLTYRTSNSDVEEFEKHLNKILSTNDILNKKAQNFLNTMFGHSMMPVISKPTCVTKNNATTMYRSYFHQLCYHHQI